MNDGELLLARDPVLQRGVWVRVVPHGAAAVATSNRDLGRPGRLRWLLGRRTAEKNWDAYEAPDGDRFLSLCERPQEWSVIRHWIADLAVEIAAAEQDGTLRPLRLEPLNIAAIDGLSPGVGCSPDDPSRERAPPIGRGRHRDRARIAGITAAPAVARADRLGTARGSVVDDPHRDDPGGQSGVDGHGPGRRDGARRWRRMGGRQAGARPARSPRRCLARPSFERGIFPPAEGAI